MLVVLATLFFAPGVSSAENFLRRCLANCTDTHVRWYSFFLENEELQICKKQCQARSREIANSRALLERKKELADREKIYDECMRRMQIKHGTGAIFYADMCFEHASRSN